MARIALTPDLRAVESAIDAAAEADADSRLNAAQFRYRRRPEFKYLRCLFDLRFDRRPVADLLRDVMGLVADQPDFMEAAALLAVLYERSGEHARAEIFARVAHGSASPSARARVAPILGIVPEEPENAAGKPPPSIPDLEPPPPRPPSVPPWPSPVPSPAPPAALDPADLSPPAPPPLVFTPPPAPFRPTPSSASGRRLSKPTPTTPGMAPPGDASRRATPPPDATPSLPRRDDPGKSGPRPSARPPPLLLDPMPEPSEPAAALSPEVLVRAGSAPPPMRSTPPPVGVVAGGGALGSGLSSPSGASEGEPAPPGPGGRVTRPAPKPEVHAWFADARLMRVHKRTPAYGVRADQSTADMLLDLAEAVARGETPLSADPVPLDRDGLARIERSLVAMRQAGAFAHGRMSERGEVTAAAAFLLAVALHELDARAVETAADDGGCKVVTASGAGLRPLVVASGCARGTGHGLVDAFDRLSRSQSLSASGTWRAVGSSPSATPTPGSFGGPASPGSAPRLPGVRPWRSATPATPPVRPASVPAMPIVTSMDPEVRMPAGPSDADARRLAVTRAEAQAAPLRAAADAIERTELPFLDVGSIATEFARSPVGHTIGERAGRGPLAPSPAGIEAIESYCAALRGERGAAPDDQTWTPSAEDEATILSWGAFLGEALIATYGGRWEADPDSPRDPRLFRVVLGDRAVAWPMTKVFLRLKNGASEHLLDFLARAGRMAPRS